MANDSSVRVSTPRYAGAVRTSRYIAMRDAIRLAIDVYLPHGLEAGARLPTILEQTRYRRSFQFRPELRDSLDRPSARIAEFVTRGYAYVVVDVRGSGASFGSRDIEFGSEEVRDGSDVVDWIVRQPWADGKVGATGISYVGTTAELLLVNRHPAVKAIVPQFSLLDTYTDIVLPGGVPQSWFLSVWAQTVAAMDRNELSERGQRFFLGTRPVDGDSGSVLLTRAVSEHANPDVNENLRRIVFRDDTALAGWTLDEISPHTKLEDIRAAAAAIYSYSGWYDGAYPRAAAFRFRAVSTQGSRLVLGPWNHGGGSYYSPPLGSRPSSFPHTRELLRFFDHHLKGIKTGIADEPRVHYYTMGEERWKTANAWPIPETRTESWYLAGGGVLSPTRPSGLGGVDTYRVDTTTTTGGRSRWNTLVGGGAVDYPDRSAEDRKLLTYTSGPLEQDLEVTGHPVVALFVSSTATDGTFFVYLEEVDEQGQVRYVTEGELRAVHRKLSGDPPPYASIIPYRSYLRRDAAPLVAGQVAELTFDLIPTSYLFRKGRRIRVALAGTDMNHFAVIPAVPPIVGFYREGARASRIDLPVIPR
ncbi:MAG: CocE/NonD family hydrolase [Gemmatimonadota bacterium]|nr:CocE/NonD family hydrolase [Gemmatimonadota bacterium]